MNGEGSKITGRKIMDGYEILISSLQMLLEQKNPRWDSDDIELQIASLQIVSGKSKEEINALYNTGAFNEITYGYLYAVMQHCDIAEDKQKEMLGELSWLHDTMSAAEILKIQENTEESEETEDEWGE